jgi:hypothetical protein
MNRLIALLSAAALIGCAGEQADSDTPEQAADMPGEEMAATIALADVAGTWSLTAMREADDSVITTYEMMATETTEGWTVTFPDRDPMPAGVDLVDGDSIVIVMGPYESVLRAGVMVTVRSVAWLQDDMMTGTFTARYETTEADSIMQGRIEGTRSMQ